MGLRQVKIIIAVGGALWLVSSASAQEVKYEKLDDGKVEHWFHAESQRTWFQIQIENLSNVIWPEEQAPFGRSVALLTGVSVYQYLTPDLPSVENDLEKMQEFLIGPGGFDEVYLIKNENLDRDIVERYMKRVLPQKVKESGRILFYYSGHGNSIDGGKTGYLQFKSAKQGEYDGKFVLAGVSIKQWFFEIKVKHLLVLLDCCSSGLGFTSRGSPNCNSDIVKTLSGDGSRIIFTAGTADQETYAKEISVGSSFGIFTKAFLDAFKTEREGTGKCTLYTARSIFDNVYLKVKSFAEDSGYKLTPLMTEYDRENKQGTFIFLNPGLKGLTFTDEQIAAGGFVKKSELTRLRVLVKPYGSIYIDGELKRKDNKEFEYSERLTPGKHKITVKHDSLGYWEREIEMKPDSTTELIIDFNNTVRFVIASPPTYGEIIINEQSINQYTPYEIELPIGTYIIEVRRDGFEVVGGIKIITIDEDSKSPVKFKLETKK